MIDYYYNILLYNNSIYNISFTQRSCLVSTKQLLVFIGILNSRGIKNRERFAVQESDVRR